MGLILRREPQHRAGLADSAALLQVLEGVEECGADGAAGSVTGHGGHLVGGAAVVGYPGRSDGGHAEGQSSLLAVDDLYGTGSVGLLAALHGGVVGAA